MKKTMMMAGGGEFSVYVLYSLRQFKMSNENRHSVRLRRDAASNF